MADNSKLLEDDDNEPGCCTSCCHRLGCQCGGGFEGDLLSIQENKHRSCTDMLLLIIFILAIVGEVYIAVWAAQVKGADPSRLLMAYDYEGNDCTGDTPYVIWPDVTHWNFRICAADCSESISESSKMATCGLDNFHGYETELWLDLYCFPSSKAVIEQISGSGLDSFNIAMGDLYKAQWAVAASIGVTLLVCFAYISWLQCGGECFIWTCLALVALSGAALGGTLIYKSAAVRKQGWEDSANAMHWTGVICFILDVLFIITMCCIRKRIELAVELVGEAGRALKQLAWLIFFPLVTLCLMVGFFTFWIIVAMYIFSVNVETEEAIPSEKTGIDSCIDPKSLEDIYGSGTFLDEDWDQTVVQEVFWYHIFMGFWGYQFIQYWSYMVIAGAYSEWYFSPWTDDNFESKTMNTSTPVLNNVWRVTRYHLGTVAFGSLIIAVINTLRAMLMYVMSKTEGSDWSIAKCVYSCLQCILKCLNCCIDKINKDGFIFTIIYGIPFCPASIKAFDLNLSHLDYVGAVTVVSGLFISMGKVVISSVTTGSLLIAIQYFGIYGENDLSSLMLPTVAIFIISWGISHVFLDIFETGIETLFVCFINDVEINHHPNFAHPEMAKIVERNSDDSVQIAEQMARIRGDDNQTEAT